MLFAVEISAQLIMNGMHSIRFSFCLPSRSIKNPAVKDPIGVPIATRLAIQEASEFVICILLSLSVSCGNKIAEYDILTPACNTGKNARRLAKI